MFLKYKQNLNYSGDVSAHSDFQRKSHPSQRSFLAVCFHSGVVRGQSDVVI